MELLNHLYSYRAYENVKSLTTEASKSGRKSFFIQSNRKSQIWVMDQPQKVWDIDLEERLGMETCQKLGNTSKLACKASLVIAKSVDSLKVKFFEKAFPEFALFPYQFMPVSCQFSGFKPSNFAKQGISKFHSLVKMFSLRGGAVRPKSHSRFYR